MSLTTVAANVQPDEALAKLPPSHPERFKASDFIAAAIVFCVTLGVYVATLAPDVTLEDSGELITAAAKFGVGHPPGYPLWTMSGFLLSHIFPFGNLAWRMNLLCALFGATSNAVLTLLACHSGRWLLQRWTEPEHQAAVRPYVFYMGLLVGLTIGFSDVMWSQAVISAVHGTLNALFVNLVLLLFYLWMLEPRKTHRLVFAVFVFSLGLTNHHTLVQVIPAFLLTAFLFQVAPPFLKNAPKAPMGIFFSVVFAVSLFSLSILVYISWLSGDNDLQTISQAMAWLILGFTAVVSFFYLREFRLHLFLLGAATALAICAYGYYLLDPGRGRYSPLYLRDRAPLVDGGQLRACRLAAGGWSPMRRRGMPPLPRRFDPRYLAEFVGMAALALGTSLHLAIESTAHHQRLRRRLDWPCSLFLRAVCFLHPSADELGLRLHAQRLLLRGQPRTIPKEPADPDQDHVRQGHRRRAQGRPTRCHYRPAPIIGIAWGRPSIITETIFSSISPCR